MNRSHHLLLAAALACCSQTLTAQAVLVVDEQNRPGTDFVDILPAITAAAPGTTIRVRAGTYSGFFSNKGVHIQGEPGVFVTRLQHPLGSIFSVSNLPANQTFSMREVTIGSGLFSGPGMGSNQGRVILQDVECPSMFVDQCAQVELNRCSFRLIAQDSTLSISEHEALGLPGNPFFAGALNFADCTATLTDSNVTGGAESPAIQLTQSTLSISLRRFGSFVVAGSPTTTVVPSIVGSGTVRWDPVSLIRGTDPNPFGLPFVGISGPNEIQEEIPTLFSEGGGIGDTFEVRLAGEPGLPYLVLFGAPAPPLVIAGVGGSLWVRDPLILQGGSFSAIAVERLLSTIPNAPVLIGLPVSRQVLSLDRSGGLQLSNATTYVIRP